MKLTRPIIQLAKLALCCCNLIMLENITWKLKTNIPCHSIDLYTHISLFEKTTPVLKLGFFLVRKKEVGFYYYIFWFFFVALMRAHNSSNARLLRRKWRKCWYWGLIDKHRILVTCTKLHRD